MTERYMPDLNVAGQMLGVLEERVKRFELENELVQQEAAYSKIVKGIVEENYKLRNPEIKVEIGNRFMEDASGENTFLAKGDEGRLTHIMDGTIQNAKLVVYEDLDEPEINAELTIQTKGKEKLVEMPIQVILDEKALFLRFQSVTGIHFNQKGSAKRRRELLQALVLEKISHAVTEKRKGRTGWTESKGEHRYQKNRLGEYVKSSNLNGETKQFLETFEGTRESIFLLAFQINSLLKTILIEKGIRFSKLLVLSGNMRIVNSSIRKLLVTPTDGGTKQINLNTKEINKILLEEKDTCVVVMEGSALGSYQRDKRAVQIQKLICAASGMETIDKLSGKECECNICLVSMSSGTKELQENVIHIYCETEQLYTGQEKTFFENFLAYVGQNLNVIKNRIDELSRDEDESADEFALRVSLMVFECYIRSLGFTFSKNNDDLDSVFKMLHEVFLENKILEDYAGMTSQVRFAFENWLKMKKVKVLRIDTTETKTDAEKIIYVGTNHFYMRHADFKQLMEETFPNDEPVVCFLRALADDDFLATSEKEQHSFTKKVYIPSLGKRVRMLHFKRQFLEDKGAMPLI